MKKGHTLPEPRYIIDESGKKIEVVLDLQAYNKLIELIEDFGLGKMAQAVLVDESPDDYISLNEIRNSLLKK
ncbi:MAG: hypothetical protein WD068_01665 [Candidatus Babeliales bacterium]